MSHNSTHWKSLATKTATIYIRKIGYQNQLTITYKSHTKTLKIYNSFDNLGDRFIHATHFTLLVDLYVCTNAYLATELKNISPAIFA